MLLWSGLCFLLGSTAIFASLQLTEEIESLFAVLVATVFLFFGLFFAPLPLQLLVAIALLVRTRTTSSWGQID